MGAWESGAPNEESESSGIDASALLDQIVERVGTNGDTLANIAGRFGTRFKHIRYDGKFPDFIKSSGVLVISDGYVCRSGYEHATSSSRWRVAGTGKEGKDGKDGKATGKAEKAKGGKKGKGKAEDDDDDDDDDDEEEEDDDEEDEDD